MTNQLLEDLQATKMILLTGGWCKGSYEIDKPSPTPGEHVRQHCTLGAIEIACTRDVVGGISHGRYAACGTAIAEAAGLAPDRKLIPVWNDAPERTFRDVLAAINLAIAQATPIEVEVAEPAPVGELVLV